MYLLYALLGVLFVYVRLPTKRKVLLQAPSLSKLGEDIEAKSENTLDAVFTSNTLAAEETPCMVKLEGILRLRWLRSQWSKMSMINLIGSC